MVHSFIVTLHVLYILQQVRVLRRGNSGDKEVAFVEERQVGQSGPGDVCSRDRNLVVQGASYGKPGNGNITARRCHCSAKFSVILDEEAVSSHPGNLWTTRAPATADCQIICLAV